MYFLENNLYCGVFTNFDWSSYLKTEMFENSDKFYNSKNQR